MEELQCPRVVGPQDINGDPRSPPKVLMDHVPGYPDHLQVRARRPPDGPQQSAYRILTPEEFSRTGLIDDDRARRWARLAGPSRRFVLWAEIPPHQPREAS